MQIETTMRYLYILMANLKKISDNAECWWGCLTKTYMENFHSSFIHNCPNLETIRQLVNGETHCSTFI